jgi:hypothetical protein
MVEALTGLMIGGVFGPHLKKMYGDLDSYRDLSSFILVIDPAVFGPADGYLMRTQQMIDELHSHPPAPGIERVMVPGEIETRTMEHNRREGIPVPKAVYDFLSSMSNRGRCQVRQVKQVRSPYDCGDGGARRPHSDSPNAPLVPKPSCRRCAISGLRNSEDTILI